MASATPYPCMGARARVLRINMSRVPGSRSGFLAMSITIGNLWVECQWLRSNRSHNGGSLRIYEGQLGFQAERIAWNFPSPALAAGFLLELLRGYSATLKRRSPLLKQGAPTGSNPPDFDRVIFNACRRSFPSGTSNKCPSK